MRHSPPQSEVDALSKELNFSLLPLANSPLPDDRPIWRHVTVSFMLQYYKHNHTVAVRTRVLSDRAHYARVRCAELAPIAAPICSASVQEISRRLWDCTHGNLGDGQLPGLTSELLVNVDSRARRAPPESSFCGLLVRLISPWGLTILLLITNSFFISSLARFRRVTPRCGMRRCRTIAAVRRHLASLLTCLPGDEA